MPTVFENKPDFLVILQNTDDQRPILRDAWVDYLGERWYPVMVPVQKSGTIGFEGRKTALGAMGDDSRLGLFCPTGAAD